jgi:hypothetical protein
VTVWHVAVLVTPGPRLRGGPPLQAPGVGLAGRPGPGGPRRRRQRRPPQRPLSTTGTVTLSRITPRPGTACDVAITKTQLKHAVEQKYAGAGRGSGGPGAAGMKMSWIRFALKQQLHW